MDGENDGKTYFIMDDLGVPLFFGNTHISYIYISRFDRHHKTRFSHPRFNDLNRCLKV